MMKKGCIILIIAALFAVPVSAREAGTDEMVSLISSLNIMNGYPDGSFGLENGVTRAEFTKIAVAASQYRNAVATNLTVSPFKDVPYSHWAAPYIKLAVTNKLVTGYVDSTFRPDEPVLYEEAATVALKLLGYTDEDFGSAWPYGQVGLAQNLELTDGIDKTVGQAMTRGDVVRLIYNLLGTRQKDGNTDYISIFDSEIVENVILIATHAEDPSVGSDVLVTSNGNYRVDDGFDSSMVGRQGDLVVKNGDTVLSFAPYDQQVTTYNVDAVVGADLVLDGNMLDLDENLTVYYKSQQTTYQDLTSTAKAGDSFTIFATDAGVVEYALLKNTGTSGIVLDETAMTKYVVYSKLENAVVTYRDGALSQIDIPDSTDAYRDGQKSTFGTLKSELEMGDILYVKLDGNGRISYINVEKGNMQGPVTVKTSTWYNQFGDISGATVMRDGVKVTLDDIQINDVAYYSSDLGMLFTYSNKITGVYQKASPNKDLPETITVSGVEYTLEGVAAFNAVSSSGSFNYGDTVTLLMGKSGQVADVISPSQTSVTGYLTGAGNKEYTNADGGKYTSYYVTVALPDGSTGEYATGSDYSKWVNSVVTVNFKDSGATVTVRSSSKDISGTVNAAQNKLGTHTLAANVQILDVSTTDREADAAAYAVIFPQRLDGVDISASDVVYYETDSRGDISVLILEDVSGDMYQYGIVTKADSNISDGGSRGIGSTSGSYTCDIGGTSMTLSLSNAAYTNITTGTPVKAIVDSSGRLQSLFPLTQVDSEIESVASSYIETEDGKLELADDVVVYQRQYDYSYQVIPLSDVIGSSTGSLSAFYDKRPSSGGRVRVLVVY